MVPHHTKFFWDLLLWIVNEPRPGVSGTLNWKGSSVGRNHAQKRMGFGNEREKTKKSGLKVVTLIATLNPVSQVLW
jgi:hypothetical protein